MAEIIQWLIGIAGCIFDRTSDQSDIGSEANGFGDDLRCVPNPLSRSADTGKSVAFTIVRACVRASSRVNDPSLLPRAQAEAALDVASASNPEPARMRVEATSHGFGITNAPGLSCRMRKRTAFSFCFTLMPFDPRDSGFYFIRAGRVEGSSACHGTLELGKATKPTSA